METCRCHADSLGIHIEQVLKKLARDWHLRAARFPVGRRIMSGDCVRAVRWRLFRQIGLLACYQAFIVTLCLLSSFLLIPFCLLQPALPLAAHALPAVPSPYQPEGQMLAFKRSAQECESIP